VAVVVVREHVGGDEGSIVNRQTAELAPFVSQLCRGNDVGLADAVSISSFQNTPSPKHQEPFLCKRNLNETKFYQNEI
jgi:hypothetical protein